jgi:hypothetical protein
MLVFATADLTLRRPGKIRSFAQSKSVGIRLEMWRWSLALAKRNPVSGLGAGGFLSNVGEVAAPDMNRKPGYHADIVDHAHNEPLEILVELGVLGLAAFLWPIVSVLRAVLQPPALEADGAFRSRLGAFAAGWLAVVLQSFLTVGIRFWSVPVVFYTGLGLLAAGARSLKKGETEGADEHAEPAETRQPAATPLVLLAIVLLAAGYFVVYRGISASVAMHRALDARTSGGARFRWRPWAAAAGLLVAAGIVGVVLFQGRGAAPPATGPVECEKAPLIGRLLSPTTPAETPSADAARAPRPGAAPAAASWAAAATP